MQDQKANTKPKNKQNRQKTPKKHAKTTNKNKNQHGRWSAADQFIDNSKMQEEMITLNHLRDWYGKVKQERNNKHQSAIQQSVSQEATDAQCGNQGSPQPLVWFLFGLLLCVLSFCLLCCCNGIVTAARLCTGPIPVHFCGPQLEGGYVYAIIG